MTDVVVVLTENLGLGQQHLGIRVREGRHRGEQAGEDGLQDLGTVMGGELVGFFCPDLNIVM